MPLCRPPQQQPTQRAGWQCRSDADEVPAYSGKSDLPRFFAVIRTSKRWPILFVGIEPIGADKRRRSGLGRERLRDNALFNGARPGPGARGSDRPACTRKGAERWACIRKEKATVRMAASKCWQLAERYRIARARHRRSSGDRTVFRPGQNALNGRHDGSRCSACADAMLGWRDLREDGTAAARAAVSRSVSYPVAVAIRLPVEQPGAAAATGHLPPDRLRCRLKLRLQTTTLSKTRRRPGGNTSWSHPLPWNGRSKQR